MLGALPPVFAGLEPDDAQEAAGYLQPLTLEAGEIVMEQGEEDFTLAFIAQGAVQLLDGEVRIGGAGARDLLGEIELFGQIPRVATAVASGPVSLQLLAYEHYLELCERGNPAVYNLERYAHRRMTERMRWLSEGIAERTRGAPFELRPKKGLFSRFFRKTAPPLDVATELLRSPLFSWADPALVAQIAQDFGVEKLDAEQALCKQGEVGDRMYVLVEGKVDIVVMIGQTHGEVVATLGAGAAFGEASLALNTPRNASVVCHEDVVLLTLTREKYGELYAVDDPLGSTFRQAMLRNLISQLMATQQRYVELEAKQAAKVEETLRGTPVSTVWRD